MTAIHRQSFSEVLTLESTTACHPLTQLTDYELHGTCAARSHSCYGVVTFM